MSMLPSIVTELAGQSLSINEVSIPLLSGKACSNFAKYQFMTIQRAYLLTAVLSLLLLVYDYVINLSKEIRFFWRVPRTAFQTLYLASRYVLFTVL